MALKPNNRQPTDQGTEKASDGGHRASNESLLNRIDELQDFYDYSPIGYLTLDPKGRILDANLTAVAMMKVVRSDLVGHSLYDHVHWEDRDVLYTHLRRLFNDRTRQSCELRLQTKDGKIIHAALASIYTEDRKGLKVCRSALTNITDHMRTEQAFRESEERLRLAVEGGLLGTWDWDLITGGIVGNPRQYKLLGLDPDGPVNTVEQVFAYIHPDDLERVQQTLDELLRTGREFKDEFRIIPPDGETRWLGLSGRVYRDADGRPVRMAGVTYDITNRKRMEEELRRSRDELEVRVRERTAELQKKTDELEELNTRLQKLNKKIEQEHGRRKFLAKRLVEILEKERREIANALHDEAGQTLASLKMDLELMEADQDLQRKVELLSSAKKKISVLFSFIKDITWQLRPSVLDTLGFLPAVHSMIDQLKMDGVGLEIEFFASGAPERLDHDKETALYRIIQEALTNCIKYAEAKKVYINYIERDAMVVLTIEDDGQGFDYNKVSRRNLKEKTALGINIMRERVMQFGGTFWIDSAPGKGTFITVELPLEERSKEAFTPALG